MSNWFYSRPYLLDLFCLLGQVLFRVVENDNQIEINTSGSVIQFDKKSGKMTSWKHNGQTVITDGPEPNFWRPPIDNDYGARFAGKTQGLENGMAGKEKYSSRTGLQSRQYWWPGYWLLPIYLEEMPNGKPDIPSILMESSM